MKYAMEKYYGSRYATWMAHVDATLFAVCLMEEYPERAQLPQTHLVQAEHMRARTLKARWTPYAVALIQLQQCMRKDDWIEQPLSKTAHVWLKNEAHELQPGQL
eukprot:4681681-Amphidinium_carterae.1